MKQKCGEGRKKRLKENKYRNASGRSISAN
jgi:hypothetical protein